MVANWPGKAKPYLYRRLDTPPPEVKHDLKVGDFVKIVGDDVYVPYGMSVTWVDALLPGGAYSVGCPMTGYAEYERKNLRLLHRETQRERITRQRR